MKSKIVFFLLVGLVCGHPGTSYDTPGWENDIEYIYKVNGRTLARPYETSDQYSGILITANLKIQPKSDGKLQGLISESKYSHVHSKLPHGFNSFIPDSELVWRPLDLSSKPFQIEMEAGVITDLIVSKDMSEWQANILKGIVSQFQLNTNARNPSSGFQQSLPDGEKNSAIFVTMEDTVSGKTSTLYEIRPIPKHVVQYNKQESKYLDFVGDGEVIEVVKHKNYSEHMELPSYFYGFGGMELFRESAGKAATNSMGRFITRDTISRAVLTGSLREYTVRSSVTTNKVFVSPNMYEAQRASVISVMNVTFESMGAPTQNIPEVPRPVRLGNLVYTYTTLSQTDGVHEKQPYYKSKDFESEYSASNFLARDRRDGEEYHEKDYKSYKLTKPKLSEAPRNPFQPFSSGFKGKSIKEKINVVESVQKLAREIGNSVENSGSSENEKDLDKYVMLISLIRIMNFNEIESTTSALYSNAEQGPKRATWSIYSDAVSQAGTGPALLCIKHAIETNKLKGEEASSAISTMANAIREPTLDYLKDFFELIKAPQVQSEWPLNDTALLSFTDLIRRVYFEEQFSDNQYPVKTFGKFRSKEGENFVEEEVIPYLRTHLNEAIAQAETHKIHAFIRAIGNTGHPYILTIFEPYLEGRKQISQFQRFLMIISLEKLVMTHPKLVLPVLVKVYQNPGETPEVRMAAVYQIMRCSPKPEVLQMMASYTNTDPQERVNAAVKSSIESAARLEGPEFHTLSYAAQTALPLLTKKVYNLQFGANHLRSYVDEELKMSYKQNAQSFGSDDALLPKGFRYTLRENLNGMKTRLGNVQSFVSSTEELLHVFAKHYANYERKEKEQEEQFPVQQRYPWSSAYINDILYLKPAEREQLEGTLLAQIGSYYRMFSFDNLTIARFPEAIRELEEKLNRGMHFDRINVMNDREMTVSFPTEMGVPFIFTRDEPIMMKVQGKISAVSTPKLYQSSGKVSKPDSVRVSADMSISVSKKIQSRLIITTPFDSHQFISGYDKHSQVYLPVGGNLEIDIKNMETRMELVPKKTESECNLYHYATWPYTSKSEIVNLEPLSSQSNTKVIKPDEYIYNYESKFGKRETGMVFKVEIQHERGFLNSASLWQLLTQRNFISGMSKLWNDNTIQYSRIAVSYLPKESPIRKAVLRLGYKQQYTSESEPELYSKFSLDNYSKSSDRQQKMIEIVSAGIEKVMARSIDVSADFHGDHTMKYVLTGAVGKSNMDPKSRIIVSYKNSSDSFSAGSYEVHFTAKSYIPNTNALNMDYAFDTEPVADTDVEFRFGPSQEPFSKIDVQFRLRRSEERKQYLKKLPMYSQCRKEMKNGNYQMPVCVNMTMSANLLDNITMHVVSKNLKPESQEAIVTLYEAIRFYYLPNLRISRRQSSLSPHEVMMKARFHPDLKFVNVSIETHTQESNITNIPVSELARKTFVSHPVFHLKSRYMSHFFSNGYFRPMCVVDKSKVVTFSNLTYPAKISKHWTVMLQYVPKESRLEPQHTIETQLRSQLENYAVLVRQDADSSKKDFKITVSSPKTKFRVVDIELRTKAQPRASEPRVRVIINGKDVPINENESYDMHENYIQIYALPNREVKVEILNAFYMVYDGERARLSITDNKFKDSTRGLCGQFNQQKNEDFLTSENCIARDPSKFVKSFEAEGEEGKKVRDEFSQKTMQCVDREIPSYVDVVSNDVGYSSYYSKSSIHHSKCTVFQTRYVQQNGDICFTIRALPVCSSHCHATGYVSKNVPVHCVHKSHVAELWKSQIDKGSSPDFSNKEEHKSVSVRVPQNCSQ
nr:vitellogenin-like [Leptinotarsa decemlineata]